MSSVVSGDLPEPLFDHWDEIEAWLADKDLLLFLDYDGTLTPIVATPDQAILSEEMRQTVSAAARVMTISVVSGRATDDVRGKVQIDGIYYAGSHGFEIVTPDGEVIVNEDVQKFRPIIDEAWAKLKEKVKDIPGALIEHVKYTISAHYRLVSDEDFPRFCQAVEEILAAYPQLRRTCGKKVFELRPRLEWDKGKAVQWILSALSFDPQRHRVMYVGDDTTDEDAFVACPPQAGLGVLVATPPRATRARFYIPDTDAVKRLIEQLTQLQSRKKAT